MYCRKCGANNPDENRFCDQCGQPLAGPQQDKQQIPAANAAVGADAADRAAGAAGTGGSKKKIIIAVVIALLLIAAAIVSILIYTSSKSSEAYADKMKEAVSYVEDGDYENAEACCLDAIELDPGTDDAYIQLSDIYVSQKCYSEAVTILEEGEEAAGGSEIAAKLEQARSYGSYGEFLEGCNVVELEKRYSSGSNAAGLISALTQDVTADGVPELITVSYEGGNAMSLKLSLYRYEDGEVVESDRLSKDFGDAYSVAGKLDIFMKENEGKYYLVAGNEMLDPGGGMIATYVYSLSSEIEEVEALHASSDEMGFDYIIGEERVAGYESGFDEYDEDSANEEVKKGCQLFNQRLEQYGLINRVSLDKWGSPHRLVIDEDDSTETGICFVQKGVYMDDGQVDFQQHNKLYFEDYTDVRTWAI